MIRRRGLIKTPSTTSWSPSLSREANIPTILVQTGWNSVVLYLCQRDVEGVVPYKR